MVKLTQQIVENRVKGLDYRKVVNLNIWGTDIDNIDFFTKMPLLEVLSLSLNQVTTLEGLKNCVNLKELYLRRNLIEDIEELNYLKDAKNLKTFCLLENPCTAALGAMYRRSVIRHLPQLRFLDGVAISQSELRSALHDGPPPETPNPITGRASTKNMDGEVAGRTMLQAARGPQITHVHPESMMSSMQQSHRFRSLSAGPAINRMIPMPNDPNHAASPNCPERANAVCSNGNILSAILLLTLELDSASLVVLKQAVLDRMAKMLPAD